MNELMDFLMSKEVVIVILIAIGILMLGTLYFIIEKVVLVKRITNSEKEVEEYDFMEEENSTKEQVEIPFDTNKVVESVAIESSKGYVEAISDKPAIEDIYQEVKKEVKKQDELAYTEIVPNKEEARKELEKVTEELIRNEEGNNIELTRFEEEQEENAIISMDELLQKSGVLYEKNEITQYLDEGNEPISLTDLEMRMNERKESAIKEEPIDIPPVIPIEKIEKQQVEIETLDTEKPTSVYQERSVFKSSPIISPIFGIEKSEPTPTSMELENTANYPKFDQEMKKTNEFLTTLKELQKNLK